MIFYEQEEQQAYARLHRYGQKDQVEATVYYTPVSVESRLLEWRKRSNQSRPDDENVEFATVEGVHSHSEHEEDSEEEEKDDDDEEYDLNEESDEDVLDEQSLEDEAEETENQTRFLLNL